MKKTKPSGKSSRSKGGHGGPRRGSGRKSNIAKRVLKRVQATHAETADAMFKMIVSMAKSDQTARADRIRAAIYICDRVWGRPSQAITLPNGPLVRIVLPAPATEPPPGVGPKRA